MKVEQAIEVLTRTITVNDGMQETAIRMAVQALRLLEPVPVRERHPESGVPVLGFAFGLYEGRAWIDWEWTVVEYDEWEDLWTVLDDPESKPVQVSHWMELPPEPEREDADE